MTPYSGLGFFFTLALALLPAAIAGLRGKNLRVCGFAVTAVMLLLIFDTPRKLLTLALFWAWQLALIFSYLHVRKKSEKRCVLWIFLLLSLLPLIFTKLSVFVKELSVFSMLGISYVSFRAVQILVEIYDGHLTKLCPLDVSYFLLFFPSILSGPLDRYQRFSADLQKTRSPEDYEALLREGLWRLATGAIYNFVLGNLIWQYWVSCMPDTLLGTLGYMYGYTLFMFFNFAGYSRMAIGTAYLLGIEQPENFNQPFRSVDMKDFWSRWHISLSTFLRDYVYTRFCMAALRGVGRNLALVRAGNFANCSQYLIDHPNYLLKQSSGEDQQSEAEQMQRQKPQPPAGARVFFERLKFFAARIENIVGAHEKPMIRAVDQIRAGQSVPESHDKHRQNVPEIGARSSFLEPY